MSTSRLRMFVARVERVRTILAARPPARERGPKFPIDPLLATKLRNDTRRLDRLWKFGQGSNGGELTPIERQELRALEARIIKRARTIRCVKGYGLKQADRDQDRLDKLDFKLKSPPSFGGGRLTEAEDREEAQLTARVLAFAESPEGRGRDRILELKLRKFTQKTLNLAEQNELDTLQTLYPELPLDPNDPMAKAIEAWRTAGTKSAKSNKNA